MNLSDKQIKALMSHLNQGRIASRSQSGRSLSYLEAWDVKATLIRVFGFGGFSAEVTHTQILKFEDNVAKSSGSGTNFRVTALCTVKLTLHSPPVQNEDGSWDLGQDVVYSESAVSSQSNPDPGEAADFAVKTAESDALKRAATYLGTQFGLSLYDKGSTQDVVRVLLHPGQAEQLERVRAESEAQHSESVKDLQGRLDAATGATAEASTSE